MFGKIEKPVCVGREFIALSDDAKQSGLGAINREKMTSTRDVVTAALSLKRAVTVDELYTAQFLTAR